MRLGCEGRDREGEERVAGEKDVRLVGGRGGVRGARGHRAMWVRSSPWGTMPLPPTESTGPTCVCVCVCVCVYVCDRERPSLQLFSSG